MVTWRCRAAIVLVAASVTLSTLPVQSTAWSSPQQKHENEVDPARLNAARALLESIDYDDVFSEFSVVEALFAVSDVEMYFEDRITARFCPTEI